MESVACDGMESRRRREWHHAPACISVGLIPCATLSQFHARLRRNSMPQQVADQIHPSGVILIKRRVIARLFFFSLLTIECVFNYNG